MFNNYQLVQLSTLLRQQPFHEKQWSAAPTDFQCQKQSNWDLPWRMAFLQMGSLVESSLKFPCSFNEWNVEKCSQRKSGRALRYSLQNFAVFVKLVSKQKRPPRMLGPNNATVTISIKIRGLSVQSTAFKTSYLSRAPHLYRRTRSDECRPNFQHENEWPLVDRGRHYKTYMRLWVPTFWWLCRQQKTNTSAMYKRVGREGGKKLCTLFVMAKTACKGEFAIQTIPLSLN